MLTSYKHESFPNHILHVDTGAFYTTDRSEISTLISFEQLYFEGKQPEFTPQEDFSTLKESLFNSLSESSRRTRSGALLIPGDRQKTIQKKLIAKGFTPSPSDFPVQYTLMASQNKDLLIEIRYIPKNTHLTEIHPISHSGFNQETFRILQEMLPYLTFSHDESFYYAPGDLRTLVTHSLLDKRFYIFMQYDYLSA